MGWQSRLLSDLVAGTKIGLVGADLTPIERSELVQKGVLGRPVLPEAGSELRILVDGKPAWRVFIPQGDGFLAHPNGETGKAVALSAAEAAVYTLDRGRLYNAVATDLSCRPEVRELASGVWLVGAFPLRDGTRARVVVVERGARRDDLVTAIKRMAFKCIFVLAAGTADGIRDGVEGSSEKTIHNGVLEASAHRFFSDALEGSGDLATSQPNHASIDSSGVPPILAVHGIAVKLPTNGNRPSDGVLLLEYLFDHPGGVISSWDLEGAVFPERREKHGVQFGVDDRMSPEAEGKLKHRARELKEILSDTHAAPEEIDDAHDELERISQEIAAARAPGGKRKQLGSSDAQKATGRVRKALDKVVERVREQNAVLGRSLDQALDRATEVQFRPPPEWGL